MSIDGTDAITRFNCSRTLLRSSQISTLVTNGLSLAGHDPSEPS